MVPEPGNGPRNEVCRPLVSPVFTVSSSAAQPPSLLKCFLLHVSPRSDAGPAVSSCLDRQGHDRSQASSPDKQTGGDCVHTWQCNAARGASQDLSPNVRHHFSTAGKCRCGFPVQLRSNMPKHRGDYCHPGV